MLFTLLSTMAAALPGCRDCLVTDVLPGETIAVTAWPRSEREGGYILHLLLFIQGNLVMVDMYYTIVL